MKLPNPAKLLTEFRHAGIAIVGVLAQVIELGVLHGTALHYAQVASAVLTAATIAGVDNVPHWTEASKG